MSPGESAREFKMNVPEWLVYIVLVVIVLGSICAVLFRNAWVEEVTELKKSLEASNSERDICRAGSDAAQLRVAELLEDVTNREKELDDSLRVVTTLRDRLDHQSREIAELQGVVEHRDREIEALRVRGEIGATTIAKILDQSNEIRVLDGVVIKKENDHRMLQFLDRLQFLIAHDIANGIRSWSRKDVESFFRKETLSPFTLRERLLDLIEHRNEEFVSVLNKFPPDIRVYFMGVTIAKEKATTA